MEYISYEQEGHRAVKIFALKMRRKLTPRKKDYAEEEECNCNGTNVCVQHILEMWPVMVEKHKLAENLRQGGIMCDEGRSVFRESEYVCLYRKERV